MGLLYGLALALSGCGEDKPIAAETLAFERAMLGEAGAAEVCLALPDEYHQGDCVVAFAKTVPVLNGIPELCDRIRSSTWRGECHFVLAERFLSEGQIDLAIDQCRAAGPFVKDCARHLWKIHARRRPDQQVEFMRRLRREFPEHESSLDLDNPVIRGMAAQERRRAAGELRVSDCEFDPDPEPCRVGVERVLAQRWRRAAREDPAVLTSLCASPSPSNGTFRGLAWEPGPLDQVVARVRVEECGGSPTSPDPGPDPDGGPR